MKKKYNIGVLLIATNKYIRFAKNILNDIDKHFLNGHDVTPFLFTDHEDYSHDVNFKKYKIDHKPWPKVTLERYHTFLTVEEELQKCDYLFYLDVDMKIVQNINEEILGESVATVHPGYRGGIGTPERRRISTACIASSCKNTYFAGGFNGGSSKEFLRMSKAIKKNIEQDYKNNIIARWHDESHMNKWFYENEPSVKLSPSYCYAEGSNLAYEPKIIALNKNHSKLRAS
jgi:histo-blood group ABO system transferase